MKKILNILLRIVISCIVLYFVLRKVSFNEMLARVKLVNLPIFLTSFLCYILLVLFLTLRWQILLKVKNINISFNKLLAYYLIGLFYNNVFPTAIGGGVIRGIYATKSNGNANDIGSSILTELLIGGWSIIFFATFLSLFWFNNVKKLVYPIFVLFLLVTLGIYLLYNKKFIKKFNFLIEKIKLLELNKKLKEFYNAFHTYIYEKEAILWGIIVSFGIQFSVILMNISIGLSLNLDIPIMAYIVYSAIINVLIIIPITINGLGIREWGYTYLFSQYIGHSSAVALSLLFYFVGVIGSLFGGVIFPFVKVKNEA